MILPFFKKLSFEVCQSKVNRRNDYATNSSVILRHYKLYMLRISRKISIQKEANSLQENLSPGK